MNATAINYCTTGNNTLNKRRIVKCIFVVIYLCIYIINYKRVNAYFNKKTEEKAWSFFDKNGRFQFSKDSKSTQGP